MSFISTFSGLHPRYELMSYTRWAGGDPGVVFKNASKKSKDVRY